jgi:glucose-1-phosphate thymidylyltransferase
MGEVSSERFHRSRFFTEDVARRLWGRQSLLPADTERTFSQSDRENDMKPIGLVPAAGQGRRIAPLPMSKELYPISFRRTRRDGSLRAKVACEYLLERMRLGGANKAYVIIRPGKWDIPNYLGDGSAMEVALAYLMVHVPFGVPFSLDQAYAFTRDATVLLGFPDILIWPEDVYVTLLKRLSAGSADAVLGLFSTDQPDQVGLVELDEEGVVRGVFEKSNLTHLDLMWAIAVWRPSFTEFLHQFVQARLNQWLAGLAAQELHLTANYQEVPIGDVLHAAIECGLRVEGHTFVDGRYIDIGTPQQLMLAIRQESDAAFAL